MRDSGIQRQPIDLDVALVGKVQKGETHAFRMLLERWQSLVFNLHLRMTGSRAHAEELSQETFIRAYQRIADFEGNARFSTWLYAIARNLCLDHLKRRRPAEIQEEADVAASDPTPEETVSSQQDMIRLQRLLLTLPEGPREAFILRHVEGLEYEEIAERCSTTVNNVKVRVHRAREALARAMGEKEDEVA